MKGLDHIRKQKKIKVSLSFSISLSTFLPHLTLSKYDTPNLYLLKPSSPLLTAIFPSTIVYILTKIH